MNFNTRFDLSSIRFCSLALTVLLTLTLASTAIADIVTIEVTIKSVDAKNRTITASRKGKTLELDVSKKAEVIINGKAGKLDGLVAGQKAQIDYETTLEIVTKVEATGSPSKNADDSPELFELAELNNGTYTVDPWISPDGLTIYWTFNGSVWTAQRKDTKSSFEKKQKLARGRHVTVTADGLIMILLVSRSQNSESLHEVQRKSVDDTFEKPREIRELRNESKPKNPCLSPDGLTLYFNRSRSQGTEIVYATRKSIDDSWNQPRPLVIDAGTIEGAFTWPFVMNDGLTMLCSVEGRKDAGKTGNLLMLSRKSKTTPFENPKFISAEGLDPLTGRAARYVESTRELVFARSVVKREFNLWIVKHLELEVFADNK
jgi:hypothetical protein